MNERQALDRIAALCDDKDRPGMTRAIWPDEVRAILAEVSPEPGCAASHPMVDGGRPCILNSDHVGSRHVTAAGFWWEEA